MSTMITVIYEAFVDAGASESKAKAAAEALANYESRFSKLDANLLLVKWMIGFNLAFTMAILWKVFSTT